VRLGSFTVRLMLFLRRATIEQRSMCIVLIRSGDRHYRHIVDVNRRRFVVYHASDTFSKSLGKKVNALDNAREKGSLAEF